MRFKGSLFISSLAICGFLSAQDTIAVNDIQKAILEATKGNFVSVALLDDTSSEFPEAFFEIPRSQLIGLVIDNCDYSNLPDKLQEYQQLIYFRYSWFYFSDCPNTQFPAFLTAIPKLETLRIEGIKLSAVPESIGNLMQLKTLGLYYCGLRDFPLGILKLKQLESLDLSCNKFTLIPDEIGKLNQLVELNFEGGACGATPIDHIPTSIGELSKLETVSFGYSKIGIKQLPESFYSLTKIRSFQCNGCGLERLAPEIGNFTELESLSLSNMRKFEAFPSTIFALNNLKHFRFYSYGADQYDALMKQQIKFDEWGKNIENYSFEIKSK